MFDKHVAVEAHVFNINHNNNNNMDESESSLPTSVCIAVLDSNQATVPVPEQAIIPSHRSNVYI